MDMYELTIAIKRKVEKELFDERNKDAEDIEFVDC